MSSSSTSITLLTIMRYLKLQGFQESYLCLERESTMRLYTYPKQLQFLRKIILKGDFSEAVEFILTIQSHLNDISNKNVIQGELKKACLQIYKQKLYELIDKPNEKELRKLFDKNELMNYCSEQEFQRLFTLLTCRKSQEIPQLKDWWTVTKGRLKVFQTISPTVQIVLFNKAIVPEPSTVESQLPTSKCKIVTNVNIVNLDEIIAAYLHNQNTQPSQIPISKAHLNNPNSKFNKSNLTYKEPLSPSNYGVSSPSHSSVSSVSINQQQQQQFNKTNSNKQPSIERGDQFQKEHIRTIQQERDGAFQKRSRLQANLSTVKQQQKSNSSSNVTQKQPSYQQEQINEISEQQQKSDSVHSIPRQSGLKNVSNVSSHSKNPVQQKLAFSSKHDRKDDFYQQVKPLKEQSQQASQSEIDVDCSESTSSYMQQAQSIVYNKRQPLQKLPQALSPANSRHIQRDNYTNPIPNNIFSNNSSMVPEQHFTFSHQSYIAQPVDTFQGQEGQNQQQQEIQPKKIEKLATIQDNKAIRTCQFSSSGAFFAVGTNSSILKIFYVQDLFAENKSQSLFPIYEINNLHTKSIFCLDWSSDQSSMVTCSNDLTIKLTSFDSQFISHEVSVVGRHESCIRMVKFNESQNKILSCGDDSLVKIWDMGKVKKNYNLKGHTAGVSAFRFSKNQNEVFSVSKDSTVKKWDMRTLQCVRTSKPQESEMNFIANNTDRIVVSKKNGNIAFLDDQNLEIQYEVRIHEEQIRSIECSKSQDLYLSASFDGHIGMFSQKSIHSPDYFQHNQNSEDKVVYATFLDHQEYKGFASTSTLGLCHIYSYE